MCFWWKGVRLRLRSRTSRRSRIVSDMILTEHTRIAVLCLAGLAFAAQQTVPQTAPQSKKPTSEQTFKNIQVLKGIPVDDFMGTMGIMSAALGFDCSECHSNAGTVKVDWAADTPRKEIARKMVVMMTAINHDNFSGRQVVTCWSCHRGRDRPAATPSLENVYGPGPQEMDDVLTQADGQPSADEIIDKYVQAIGGTERLAGLKSFVANGASVGFGGFGGGGKVQIFAKFPDRRATFIEFPDAPDRGASIRTYNGLEGWLKTPLTVLAEYELTGSELDGARLDAQLSFPGQIKQVLSNLRVSLPVTITDLPGPSSQTGKESVPLVQDRLVNVVQGNGPNRTLATLYFDKESGLLLRMVRYGRSPIGRIPTQVDYADYRDVGGIKMPFRMLFAWLDGRDAFQLSQVQTNIPIDAAKFGRPTVAK
jgi:photosynthetic reaction center cytochrome c subunit